MMWWNGLHMFGWGWMPAFGLMLILFWVLVILSPELADCPSILRICKLRSV